LSCHFYFYLAAMVFFWALISNPAWMRYASVFGDVWITLNFLALAYHGSYSHRRAANPMVL
jgi:hypothetical protein